MELSDIAIMFGVFLLVFFAGRSFLIGFGEEAKIPSEISSGWNSTVGQIENARETISGSVNKIQSGGIQAVAGVFSLAFGGVYFIVASLWSVFISIPTAIWRSINYLANAFSVPNEIVAIVLGIIGVLVVIKAIQFITGRAV